MTNARIAARAAAAVERTGSQSEAVAGGGGDFKLQPAGKARARLIGYVESGFQPVVYKGQPKDPANKFRLVFQLYGKNAAGEEWVRDDGKPMQISTRLFTVSRSEKARALALFKQMCPKRDAEHFIGLVSRSFWCEIEHVEGDKKAGQDKAPIFANINEDSLLECVRDDIDDDGNIVGKIQIAVPEPADADYRIFEWDTVDKADFDGLTKSEQETVRKSVKFVGSAWEALVGAGNPAATESPDQPQEDDTATEDNPVDNPVAEPTTETTATEADLPTL